jgi:membrane glycosyltransferase
LPSVETAAETPVWGDLPSDAPLAMPIQALWSAPAEECPVGVASERGYRAMALIAATLALTAPAVLALYDVLAADSIGPLDLLILLAFTPLFAWTAFSFVSALAGLFAGTDDGEALGIDTGEPAPPLASLTAVLIPIYNEAPGVLFARVQAIRDSIVAAGADSDFDFFVISDTTDGEILRDEYAQFQALRASLGVGPRVFYRHRAANTDRKAGNIAGWVRRFGGAYECMVVLDADSLMEGDTLVRLAAAMERNPSVGLIQTSPVVVNRHSLFARAEQFASRLYGPMLARGIAWWSGDQGNYWGHNAIIRVRAFAQQAGLPHLSGRKPFGGHILSHDFVEAALIRRAGWAVRMAPNLHGSYEESPPTLADLIARDRRWCQGNLQHLRVLPAAGLGWISRLHLLRGVSSYLTAPLWLALLVMSALLPMKPHWGMSPDGAAGLGAATPLQPPLPVGAIFALSIGFLLAPKIMAYLAMLASPRERRLFGGAKRALASMLLEIALSALVAPVLMLNQIWALISILAGGDSGWVAQHREEGDITLEAAADRHLGDTAVGVGLAFAAWSASTQTFWLMSPVILGLAFCIPFAALTARCDLGAMARRAGLLVIPEEVEPTALLRNFNALRARRGSEAKMAPPAPAPQLALRHDDLAFSAKAAAS